MSNKFSNYLKQKLKMKQLKIKSFLALFGLIMFANILAMGQTVNMNRYIELTVQQGEWIRLDLHADAENTGVKVVSGTKDTTLIVGTYWTGSNKYFAQAGTMRVYGNVKKFDCGGNMSKITGLDVSNNTALTFLHCTFNSLSSLNLTGCTALITLNCGSNSLSSLNLTGLAALETLYCYSNNFTTQALDEIFCALPQRQASDNAVIYPVYDASSSNHSIVLATNKQNAIAKNWSVQYYSDDTDIPATTGTYVCGTTNPCPPVSYLTATVNSNNSVTLNWTNPPQSQWEVETTDLEYVVYVGTSRIYLDYTQTTFTLSDTNFIPGNTYNIGVEVYQWSETQYYYPCISDPVFVQVTIPAPPTVNMNRYIELTVTQGDTIRLSFKAEVENTGVMVKSGNDSTILSVGTSETLGKYRAGGSTMRIYGNVDIFICRKNGTKITGLDVSHNTGLTELQCDDNNISSLDLTGLTALKWLYCYDNNLSSLNLTGLTALERLICYTNNLSSIKTSGCISLFSIDCSGNKLSACGLDSLFHQLSRRAADDKGKIMIRDEETFDQPGAFSCRDTIATNRNWRVTDDETPIANTTYACPYFTVGIEEVITDNISAKVYPNPVSNDLNIECGERIESLDIYDALGRKVISKENTPKSTTIDVSNLDNGIYILKLRTAKGSGEYKIVVND